MPYFPSASIAANDAKVARVHATAASRVTINASSCARPLIRTTVDRSSNVAIVVPSALKYRRRCLGVMLASSARPCMASRVSSTDGTGISAECDGFRTSRSGTITLLNNRLPRRVFIERGKFPVVESITDISHGNPTHFPFAARVSRAGVAARTSPGDRADFPRQAEDLSGAFPHTQEGGHDSRLPAPFQIASSSKSRRPFPLSRRQAVQTVSGLVVQALRRRRQTVSARQVVVASSDPHSPSKVNADHVRHLSVLPARSSVRPVSVSTT